MKKTWEFIGILFLGMMAGMMIDTILNNCVNIEILETSGEVKSIKKLDDKYIVELETKCWHTGNFNTLKLITDKNYQIGDTINFK